MEVKWNHKKTPNSKEGTYSPRDQEDPSSLGEAPRQKNFKINCPRPDTLD